jgi:pyrroline-5-carboxylate reductase
MGGILGFIGGGNMGEAMIKGLLKSKLYKPEEILVSDIRKQRSQYLKETYQVKTFTNSVTMSKTCQIIILAVKPQDVAIVLDELKHVITPNHLLISIAAGVSTSFLESFFAKGIPVVRVMPNTAALVLAGISALAKGSYAREEHLKIAEGLFKAVGETVIISQGLMDAVTGLSGGGPAYVAVIVEALTDGGVKMGLPREVAFRLALQTIFGTAKLLKETRLHPAQLKDMVTSPGGTTISGLHIMELKGLRGILIDAVEAATRRSQDLAR